RPGGPADGDGVVAAAGVDDDGGGRRRRQGLVAGHVGVEVDRAVKAGVGAVVPPQAGAVGVDHQEVAGGAAGKGCGRARGGGGVGGGGGGVAGPAGSSRPPKAQATRPPQLQGPRPGSVSIKPVTHGAPSWDVGLEMNTGETSVLCTELRTRKGK